MSKVDVHMSICEDLNELYARKNADYGDSFGKSFEEYGLTMACIRLEDKLNRIKALSKQEARVSDERIEDTLMDLANYSIMTLVEMSQVVPIKKGDHASNCNANCLCQTCVRDNTHSLEEECCYQHIGVGCFVTNCPDYLPEEG